MSGKMNSQLHSLFNHQLYNQQKMLDAGLYNDFKQEDTKVVPADDIKLVSYHIQQLMSEIGEILGADKRWKNFRNAEYDENNKKEEIADCLIVIMNIAMYSGIDGDELVKTVESKLNKIEERIEKEIANH